MINELSIKSYQSHKNSKFKFHPGVNIIVGISDSGKSSVLRSLKLLLQNRPLGLSFRSHFAKKGEDTEVWITLQDKYSTTKVGRIRGEESNQYKIEGYEEPFVAFGSEVPDEVSKVLNISDINCQFQMDSPFLFSETPGTVARYLNKIVNLDKIDIALHNIASKKRSTESEIKFQQTRLSELIANITLFPDLQNIEQTLSMLELLQTNIEDGIYTKDILSGVIESLEETQSKLTKLETITKLSPIVTKLDKVINEKHSLELAYDRLFNLVGGLEALETQINKDRKFIDNQGPIILTLSVVLEELQELQYTQKILSKTILDIEKCKLAIQYKQKFVEIESKKLKQLIGDVCPLCERPLQ